jgi:hypothetical protein
VTLPTPLKSTLGLLASERRGASIAAGIESRRRLTHTFAIFQIGKYFFVILESLIF